MKSMWKKRTTVGTLTMTMTAAITLAPMMQASAASSTPITQVMNWFAEPEQGGQFAAQANGDYAAVGLAATTLQGGPQVSDITLVASGKDTFGMASADTILLARQQGIPVVAIFSAFQVDPQVLIWHAKSGIKRFSDMNGHPVYVSGSAPYWKYISTKYKLTKSQQMTYTGSLVPFVHDAKAVIQGYVTEEPLTLKNDHVPISFQLVANSGFDPYQNLMFTTEQEIQQHPDVVAAFVKASQKGWYEYLSNPSSGNKLILQDSPDYSSAQLSYAVTKETPLIEGGEAATHGIGYMSKQRWALLASQMVHVGMLPKGFDASSAFTDKFIPAKPAK